MLAISYQDDDFAPATATDRLLDKLPGSTVHRHTITAKDLGAERADHFSWMKNPTEVVKTVVTWLNK